MVFLGSSTGGVPSGSSLPRTSHRGLDRIHGSQEARGGRTGCVSISASGPATVPTPSEQVTSAQRTVWPRQPHLGISTHSSLFLCLQHEGQGGSHLKGTLHHVLHFLPADPETESRKGKSLTLGTQLPGGHYASRTAGLKKGSLGLIPSSEGLIHTPHSDTDVLSGDRVRIHLRGSSLPGASPDPLIWQNSRLVGQFSVSVLKAGWPAASEHLVLAPGFSTPL